MQPADLEGGWDGTELLRGFARRAAALGERKGYRLVHTELSGVNPSSCARISPRAAFRLPEVVPTRAIPNYFQSGRGHPPHPKQSVYLDLDTHELVTALAPGGTPSPALEDESSLWRERALSAEAHLARSQAATADATAAYEDIVDQLDASRRELATGMRDLRACQRTPSRARP